MLVRTAIINDNNYEKAQDFTLTASYVNATSAQHTSTGTGTIVDAGQVH